MTTIDGGRLRPLVRQAGGAAGEAAIAVLVANNVDVRTPATPPDEPELKALPGHSSEHVVPGEVVDQ